MGTYWFPMPLGESGRDASYLDGMWVSSSQLWVDRSTRAYPVGPRLVWRWTAIPIRLPNCSALWRGRLASEISGRNSKNPSATSVTATAEALGPSSVGRLGITPNEILYKSKPQSKDKT